MMIKADASSNGLGFFPLFTFYESLTPTIVQLNWEKIFMLLKPHAIPTILVSPRDCPKLNPLYLPNGFSSRKHIYPSS